MSIIDCIGNKAEWEEYLEYKREKSHLTKAEDKQLADFIEGGGYAELAARFIDSPCPFGLPTKKLVNKLGSDKKRVVYTYSDSENYVLKLIAYKLYRYDGAMADNCFSFRKNFGVKRAVNSLLNYRYRDEAYWYKVDISNYFNSIDIGILLPRLRQILSDDAELYEFFADLLTADKCMFEGQTIEEKRGIMAGTPVSPFLANVFLIALDEHFAGDCYARYSDDIIVFAQSQEALQEKSRFVKSFLADNNLTVNEKKEKYGTAGEPWEFLGIQYAAGKVDLSPVTFDKIKGKIRRKARALYRWKLRKNVPADKAVKVMTRLFNSKFFEAKDSNDLTWSRWFFPLITTDATLKEIDKYMQQNLRYVVTGRYGKKNFDVDYKYLKSCGYRSLVNEFYKFKSVKI